jgi:hypothetical protein
MANTSAMTLIETKTLGTAQASIEFTSIPQDYTDLVILSSSRSSRTAQINDQMNIKLNGIDGSMRNLFGTGSAVASQQPAQMTAFMSTDLATANTFSNDSIYVANYTSSTNKSLSIDSVTENNATAAIQAIGAGLWSNTAAVTSITFTPLNGNFVAGSTMSLYGILKGSDGVTTTTP